MNRTEHEFSATVLPHTVSLVRFARRLTLSGDKAEDLVQDALLRAWSAFPRLREDSNVRAWLFRILLNRFRSELRSHRPEPNLSGREPESGANQDAAVFIREAVDTLPPDQRTTILLVAVEGFTCKEAAEMLEIPIGTVMSRLARARQALRETLTPALKETR